jgi:hypothetical protein
MNYSRCSFHEAVSSFHVAGASPKALQKIACPARLPEVTALLVSVIVVEKNKRFHFFLIEHFSTMPLLPPDVV